MKMNLINKVTKKILEISFFKFDQLRIPNKRYRMNN